MEKAKAKLPTKHGDFDIYVWNTTQGKEPVAIVTKNLDTTKPVLVRIHSECFTGDTLGSLRCDCGPQLETALQRIYESQNGVLIYLKQEGRGIGLFEKIRAYKLMEDGLDTHEACVALGHEPDGRTYEEAKFILKELGITNIKLLTNNPSKVSAIFSEDFTIEREPLVIEPNEYNQKYFDTKKQKFKHVFSGQEKYFFYGFTFTNLDTDIQAILDFVSTVRLHPLNKIHVGVYFDNSYFENPDKIEKFRKLTEQVEKVPHAVFVLHYSHKTSRSVADDFREIKEKLPSINTVQINDFDENYLEIVEFCTQNFRDVICSLHKENITYLDDEKFVESLSKNNSFVLLDNSRGRGKSDSFEELSQEVTKCLDRGLNNIVVAGGFGPDNLDTYHRLNNYFKFDFSIDAETRLKEDGELSQQKTIRYLKFLSEREK